MIIRKFETRRLIIRRPNEGDLQDFLSYRNDPESLEMQSLEAMEEDKASKLLSRQASVPAGAENAWVMFAVELKVQRKMIGEVGVFLSNRAARLGNLGWSINRDFRGNGYASEAAALLLKYAFEEERLRRVTATCLAQNEPSYRLMEGLGMRRECVMLKSRQQHGEWLDEYSYALLREEWVHRTQPAPQP
jgi:RimJ/RimL family protein N-acetyltransferase